MQKIKHEKKISANKPKAEVLSLVLLITLSFFLGRDLFLISPVEDSLALLNTGFSDFLRSLIGNWEYGGVLYSPLIVGSFVLDNFLFSGHPAGFASTQLLLNGLAAYLLYLYIKKTGKNDLYGILTAGLFLALPVHHENVYWLAGRGHLLALIGMLSCLVLWPDQGDKADNANTNKHKTKKVFALIAAIFAMLAYKVAFVLPILLLASLLIYRKNIKPFALIKETMPLWILTVLLLLWRLFVFGSFSICNTESKISYSGFLNLLTGFLETLIFSPDSGTMTAQLAPLFHALFLFIFFAGIWLLYFKKISKAEFFSPLIWLLCLLPFFAVDEFAPRYVYSASVATAISLSYFGLWVYEKGLAGRILFIIFAVILGGGSLYQNSQVAANWKAAGELTKSLRHELTRNAVRFNSSAVIYNLPDKIGSAHGIKNYLSYLFESGQIKSTIKNGGQLEPDALLDILDNKPDALQVWLWHSKSNRLHKLQLEETQAKDFRISFTGCKGSLTIKQFEISSLKGQAKKITDFRRWPLSGTVKVSGKNTFLINSDNITLHAPKHQKINFKRTANLLFEIEHDNNSDRCEMSLLARDGKALDGYAERSLRRSLPQKTIWRISAFERGLLAWFVHPVLIDYLEDWSVIGKSDLLKIFADEKYIEKDTGKYTGYSVDLGRAVKVERVMFAAQFMSKDRGAIKEGQLRLRFNESSKTEDQSRRLDLKGDGKLRDFNLSLSQTALPLAGFYLLAPNTGKFTLQSASLVLPFQVPAFRYEMN